MKTIKEYEYNIERYCKTEREFYDFVSLDYFLQTGHQLREWIENFDEFENPVPRCDVFIANSSFERRLVARKGRYKIFYCLEGLYSFNMEYKYGKGKCEIKISRKGVEKNFKKFLEKVKKVLDKAYRDMI